MNTTMKVIGGFLLGAAVGTATGVLIAPSSGRKTRKLLMNKSGDFAKQVRDSVDDYLDGIKDAYNDKVDAVATNGKSSIESLRKSVKV